MNRRSLRAEQNVLTVDAGSLDTPPNDVITQEHTASPHAGLLEILGTVDITQFWPTGRSDADTTKVAVQVDQDSCRFKPHPSAPWHATRFFENTVVRGRITRPPIDQHGRLTVRLEGIDAPELHYQPTKLTRKERSECDISALNQYKGLDHFYRQRNGASSTAALSSFLRSIGSSSLPCRLSSQVDRPNDVFDAYGRFVGSLELQINETPLNLNRWLLEQGLAMPTFYSSMAIAEIRPLLSLADSARRAATGIWGYLSQTIEAFDFSLREPGIGEVEILLEDQGQFVFPKLYRRSCSWAVRRKAGVLHHSFQRYLQGQPDYCFRTEDFMVQGSSAAPTHPFSDFIQAGRRVLFLPFSLVFQEAPSVLADAKGKAVLNF